MRVTRNRIGAALTLATVLVTGSGQLASAQTPPPPATPQVKPSPDPVNLDLLLTPEMLERIRKAIENPAVLTRDDRLRFYAQVVAPQPMFHARIERIIEEARKPGPVAGSVMSHSEFVSMVTPRELYSSAGISATELLQGALVNWAMHQGIKKIQEWRAAQEAEEIRAIRARIERELAALRGGGR
jgi:hypothetical protein